jgi:glucose-6-phosphate 1-dehydrogenase
VPFYLRTGKLSARDRNRGAFSAAPYALFRARRSTIACQYPRSASSRMRTVDQFQRQAASSEIEIDGVAMDAYREYFGPLAAVGYETLIYDCLIGDATLSSETIQ